MVPTVVYALMRIGIYHDDGYIPLARALLETGNYGNPPSAYHAPGYPFIQALLLYILPEQFLVLANIVFFVIASLLLFAFLQHLGVSLRLWTSIVLCLLWFANPVFLFIHGRLMAENPFVPALMAAVLFYLKFLKKGSRRNVVCFFVFLAVATYIRPVSLYLPFFLVVPVWLRGKSLRLFLLGCFLYVVLILPWGVRNQLVLNSFVISTTHSGASLWGSNNEYLLAERPDVAGTWENPIKIMRETSNADLRARIREWEALEKKDDEIAANHFATGQTIEFWKQHLWQLPWFGLQKLKWFWHYSPRHPSNRTWYYDLGGIAWYLVWLPLAILYVVREPSASFVSTFTAVGLYFSLIALVTFGSPRLRMPMEFMLILMYVKGIPYFLKGLTR